MTKEITPKTTCANQKRTGRCWIFAAVNMLRREVIEKQKLPESFEFSQSYVFFYDKLERMNYNLKLMMQCHHDGVELSSRLVQHILREPFGDGGDDLPLNTICGGIQKTVAEILAVNESRRKYTSTVNMPEMDPLKYTTTIKRDNQDPLKGIE